MKKMSHKSPMLATLVLLSGSVALSSIATPAIAAFLGIGGPKNIPVEKVEADAAAGDIDAYFNAKQLRTLDKINSTKGVFIPGFRVVYVMGGTTKARSAGSSGTDVTRGAGGTVFKTLTSKASQTVTLHVSLQGVEDSDLQTLTDSIYKDFVARLKATGVNILPTEQVKAAAAFANLEITPAPFEKKPGITGPPPTRLRAFSASELPLWFTHGDQPTDKSPFSLNNWKTIGALSRELEAVALIPQIAVSFMKMESSGNQVWFPTGAKVAVEEAAFVDRNHSYLGHLYADNPISPEGDFPRLKHTIALSGSIGDFEDVTSDETKKKDNVRNSISGAITALGMLGGVASSAKVQKTQEMALVTTPERFGEISVRAAGAVSALYVAAILDHLE